MSNVIQLRRPQCHPEEPYYAKDLCRDCYKRAHYQAYKGRQEDRRLQRVYNITAQERAVMLMRQGCRCKLCDRPLAYAGNGTHVDHDHVTNRVRGILCNQCNSLLGRADRDPQYLDRMRAYQVAA